MEAEPDPPHPVSALKLSCQTEEKIIMNKPLARPRCYRCNKKLKMFEQSTGCDCEHFFCSKHMNRHSHNCTFDMKTRRQKEIVVNNPKMEEKMVKV